MGRLAALLQAIELDESVRVVVLTGAGRAFSAGGDRTLLAGHLAGDMPDAERVTRAFGAVMTCLARLEIPVIAAVNGPVVGHAVEMLALSDLVVMGEDAYIWEMHPTVGMGVGPAVALAWPMRMSQVMASEVLLTGRKLPAVEALRLGLVNRVVPHGQEVPTAVALAEEIAALPRSGPAAVKRALHAAVRAVYAERQQ
jgi:enoyl-CoA hydratase